MEREEFMKERPILFSGAMVRGILEGRKTQTRRVVKRNSAGRVELRGKQWHIEDENAFKASPYGQSGDRLWVKETFYDSSAESKWSYRADWPLEDETDRDFHWCPSIFMPRSASRITLEITGVRVERLQEITVADCLAEGIRTGPVECWKGCQPSDQRQTPVVLYRKLWDSLNSKRNHGLYSWDKNPWVWVIEFKRI